MFMKDAASGSSRRVGKGWHVISELDVMRLVSDHSQLEHICSVLLNGTGDPLQLSIQLRDLLDTTLIPHARNEEIWMEDRLLEGNAPPIVHSLINAVRTGHCVMIHDCRRLANALETSIEVPWDLAHRFVDSCRQGMMLETLVISYLAGSRLTTEARQVLESSMISLQRGRADA